jgi:ribosomal RNA-processing protein 9
MGQSSNVRFFLFLKNNKGHLATNTKKVFSYGKPKDPNGHEGEILSLDISFDGKYLVTAGRDAALRIWSCAENKYLDALTGHRDEVTSVKFRLNSYELCSVSADRSLKLWDINQRGFMETFYGHKNKACDVDLLGEKNMVSVGEDKRPIVWKISEETQLIFKDQNFSVDCVKGINPTTFVTGSQDGVVALWNNGKTKPVSHIEGAHTGGWISAIGGIWNSDFVATGGHDGEVCFFHVDTEKLK